MLQALQHALVRGQSVHERIAYQVHESIRKRVGRGRSVQVVHAVDEWPRECGSANGERQAHQPCRDPRHCHLA